jgi:hypothetical protein
VLIRRLPEAGESLRAIAAEINRRGIETKVERPWQFMPIQHFRADRPKTG